jgi:transposase InsO family protein
VPSVSAIHRALARRAMVVPQPDKRPKSPYRRFEWPRPNDAWQTDATAWALADGREVWIMDVLDDHSRVLVAARITAGPTSQAATATHDRRLLRRRPAGRGGCLGRLGSGQPAS